MRNFSIAALILVFALLIATPNTFGEKSRPKLKPPKKSSEKKDAQEEETSLEKMVFENIPENFPLKLKWPFYSKKLGKAIDVWYVPRQDFFIDANSIAKIDGTYYILTEKNFLCSLTENGALTWAVGLKFRLTHAPKVTAFSLYISNLSKIVALDRRSGKILWNKEYDLAICTPPHVTPNTIFVGTFNKLVVAINRLTGNIVWTFSLRGDIVAPPVDPFKPKPADYILVPCLDNNLYAIDNTGKELWKFKTYGRLMSSPVIDKTDLDTFIYFGSQDTNLYCVNSISSQKLWEYRSGSPIVESPIVVKNNVYFRNVDGNFYCLDKKTGLLKWKDAKKHNIVGVTNGTDVFALSGTNTLHAVNNDTGTERWKHEMKSFVKFIPNSVDGNVIGLTKNGLILVF